MTTGSLLGDVAPTGHPLSTLLRERTRAAHAAAESSRFVTALMAGRLPVEAYAALVAQHRMIYAALERRGSALSSDAVAGRVQHAALMRSERLATDLAALFGDGWVEAADATVTSAARSYCERIEGCGPTEFVAHHYVRYLGDLAGGQSVRRAVERTYGPGTPTVFYRFDELGPVKPFRDAYRSALDGLSLDEAGRQLLLEEAVLAFDLNRAVFDDLAERYC